MTSEPFDVIVVGAGAAGCVLSARLAEGGLKVLVLEAGRDPLDPASDPGTGRPLAADCRVPSFHPFASENQAMERDIFVRHYADEEQQSRDWRYIPGKGVLYPRASGLGGCAQHHALIVVRPNDQDWNHIAALTGDESWRASQMQRYWERIERCRSRLFLWRWLWRLTGWNPTGHGWAGWMTTELAMPMRVLRDRRLRRLVLRSIGAAGDAHPGLTADWETTSFDPNERRLWRPGIAGIKIPPMSTRRHARHGARERLREAEARHPGRLILRLGCQVMRIETENGRATGVTYRQNGTETRVTAREVVLSGGTFLTPQLLMLSGIGDPAHLKAHKIKLVRALPGVGGNLQDRYEVGVVNRMKRPWAVLRGITYTTADRSYKLWNRLRWGNYKSNGLMFGLTLRSDPVLEVPDLFCFSLLADFRGYYPGYSQRVLAKDYLTWAILKAYSHGNAGTVRLASTDPEAAPEVLFNNFDPACPGSDKDVDAVVTAIRFVRRIADGMGDEVVEEAEPGRQKTSDDALRQFVRDNAWGHHACGTCKIGPEAEGGVIDSRFRLHGLAGLRVVDASVFPKIPGYFLVSAVYMIAEKAADAILEDLKPA